MNMTTNAISVSNFAASNSSRHQNYKEYQCCYFSPYCYFSSRVLYTAIHQTYIDLKLNHILVLIPITPWIFIKTISHRAITCV